MTNVSSKKRIGMFITILVSCISCSMLSTALNTALPQIMLDFNINTSVAQWLTSIYSLVMGITTLATPFLMRRCKAKYLYFGTLFLFIIGLIMDGFATVYWLMMAGRICQAAGNGVMIAQGQVMILTLYPKEKRGSVMGIYGLAVGFSPIVAPTIAGIIVDCFGWRMIFYIVLVIAVIAAGMVLFSFENVIENKKERFDLLSFALCTVGFCGILIGAGNMGSYMLISFPVLVPLIFGGCGSIMFVYRQLHMKTPFMELHILSVKRYRIAVIASMLMYAVVMATSILLPVYVQTVRGCSATISGLVVMPGAIASALVSPISGKMYDQWGIKKIFLLGAVFMTLGNIGMVVLPAMSALWIPAILNTIRCTGVGFIMMPLVTWGMSGLTKEYTSHGTALLTALRTVAGSLGSAIFVALFTISSTSLTGYDAIRVAFGGTCIIGVIQIGLAVYVLKKTEKV